MTNSGPPPQQYGPPPQQYGPPPQLGAPPRSGPPQYGPPAQQFRPPPGQRHGQPQFGPPPGQPYGPPPYGPSPQHGPQPGPGQPYGQPSWGAHAADPRAAHAAEVRAAAVKQMAIGGGVALVGIVLTIVTYSAASDGGHYVVAWGPALFGVIAFVRGLVAYTRA